MFDAFAHIAAIAESLPGEIHPAGRAAIREWLQAACRALDAGDHTEASRLLRNVKAKAAQELVWHADVLGIAPTEVISQRALSGDIVGAAEILRSLDTPQ